MGEGNRVRVGTADIAKYPFLPEAAEFVKGWNQEYFNDPLNKHIVERSADRVNWAAHSVYDSRLSQYQVEIITFLGALMLVKYIAIPSLIKRFAFAEAMRVEHFLERDLETYPDQTDRLIIQMLRQVFNLSINYEHFDDTNHDYYTMSVPDYLRLSTKLHEQKWKLVNQAVHKGRVILDGDKLARLVRAELQTIIEERIQAMKLVKPSPSLIVEFGDALRKNLQPKFEHRIMMVTEYPPCIKHAIEAFNKGENVPHVGRVLLAGYMVAIGKTEDEVVDMFRNAPDFKESVTRYQVKYLIKQKENDKFGVYGCEKLKSNNWCWSDNGCSMIKNPMQYGRVRA